MSFSRIAIINRGEPAMRAINAVREYRAERGLDLKTIALYTDPDARSSFVREADEVYSLGPPTVDDPRLGSVSAYVHHETLQQALEHSSADAVWTGWGFVAEDAAFAELCGRLGLVTIGPGVEAMRLLGDKIASKRLAEQAGVPVAPWSGGPVDTIEEALSAATRIGYPVLLKATAGGGGRGIRKVASPDELTQAFEPAKRESGSAFGDDTVFIESLVTGARHIEVQIVGDRTGTVWPVGVRDCSVQRRNQKIIEEAPSPVLDEAQHAEVMAAAARLGASVGYQSAGTVEFLYQPSSGQFSFMEVNTRLQVEHPITEVTTGLDLVKLQLDLARGELLEGEPPATDGHAIEVRLNAEDPEAGFAPAPGTVELLRFPHGPGIRVDTGIDEGDEVVSQFDSMIAKLIVTGRDRTEAVARLRRALEQTTIVIRNGSTNKGFVQQLVDHPQYLEARMDVGWVDRTVKPSELDQRFADIALLAAAIEGYEHQMVVERLSFESAAARGRPELELGDPFRTVALRRGTQSYEFAVSCVGPSSYRVMVDGSVIQAQTSDTGPGKRLATRERTYRTLAVKHGATMQIEIEGIGHKLTFDEGGVVRAPSPALVVSIDVTEGDTVSVGDRLAVIEAMKMETSIAAEFSGTVKEILVRPNVQVGAGSPLLVIDIADDSGPGMTVSRVDFAPYHDPPDPDHRRCVHKLRQLRNALLGYDIDVGPLVESMRKVRQCADQATESDRRKLEDDVLAVFSDLIAIFRQTPLEQGPVELLRRAAEGHLFDYLRDVEGRGTAQPEWFEGLLRAVLTHHQVTSLDPSPHLSAALFRLMRSRLLIEAMIPAILSILEDLIENLGSPSNPHFRAILDRLSNETVDRYPAIHDLATDIRYRLYDSPFLMETKERAYTRAREQLAAVRAGAEGPQRAALIDALIRCPQPLAPFLLRRIPGADLASQQAMLEVITRRYYRIRFLEDGAVGELGAGPMMTARYHHARDMINLTAIASSWNDLPETLAQLADRLEQLPSDEHAVVDVHVVGSDDEGRADLVAERINDLLNDAFRGRTLRRIVATVSTSLTSTSLASLFHFTYRPAPEGGYVEDRTYRDLHRMMAERLELWRLELFDTQRLPTLEDIYLFYGVAKDNPYDERLFAIAEVRDATRVGDTTDGSTRLPELERVFLEVVAAIRRVQARRPASRRLMWNRILLYVWPEIDLDRDEMLQIVRRLAPFAEGAGLEKVVVLLQVPASSDRMIRRVLEISDPSGHELILRERDPAVRPLQPLTEHEQRKIRLRQRGLVDPFDVVGMLTGGSGEPGGGIAPGSFVEHDLAGDALIPVSRNQGENTTNVVVGIISNRTDRYPDGMSRVIILGDPSRGMGNIAEAECRRIIAALDLAERLHLPVEWFAVSAGARISMESGTENMDWIGRVLRRLVEFTQAGHEVNILVTGVNVGAQPYWNAEATMLMHTKGILVMMPQSAMVLTGKDALDFSGGVSAEDNFGIGGYARIMGPNGQAQYFATDLGDACRILLEHYEYTYVAPGEHFPRRADTSDPTDRDVGQTPHGENFQTVGEIFQDETNPGRKKPFDIRQVMAATVDRDLPTMERWYGMQHAEVAVVWDAFLGGHPVCLIGLESKPVTRTGFVPTDGPDQWTAGTLFPNASKKVARAINAATGNRPLVVLANLSGFDGSPESMRRLQLEYGAEIGRAVVNFRGPIVFCVISRYHGGAFVVFSATLNDNMEVAALEGAKASVIGGAPAAAVVFAREVSRRTELDPRVSELAQQVSDAHGPERAGLLGELNTVRETVRVETMHAMAEEFDTVHNVERALSVGSIHHIIRPDRLRPYLIEAVERGMTRAVRTIRSN